MFQPQGNQTEDTVPKNTRTSPHIHMYRSEYFKPSIFNTEPLIPRKIPRHKLLEVSAFYALNINFNLIWIEFSILCFVIMIFIYKATALQFPQKNKWS